MKLENSGISIDILKKWFYIMFAITYSYEWMYICWILNSIFFLKKQKEELLYKK